MEIGGKHKEGEKVEDIYEKVWREIEQVSR